MPAKSPFGHAVEAARACGIEVGAIELKPDGTIYVGQAQREPAELPYDRWKREEAAAQRAANRRPDGPRARTK